MEMSPMRDKQQTREDRATQPMDAGRLSLAICLWWILQDMIVHCAVYSLEVITTQGNYLQECLASMVGSTMDSK